MGILDFEDEATLTVSEYVAEWSELDDSAPLYVMAILAYLTLADDGQLDPPGWLSAAGESWLGVISP